MTNLASKLYSDGTLGRLGALGGLAVGPLGRPAASPGFTPLGMSSLDTPDPGRSKASSPTFMNPRGLFLTAFSAAPFTSGLPASAPGSCNKHGSCCFCSSCVCNKSVHYLSSTSPFTFQKSLSLMQRQNVGLVTANMLAGRNQHMDCRHTVLTHASVL